MKLKYFLIIGVAFLLISTITAKAPDIDVTLLNQDPDPVRGGDVVEVQFKVENNRAETQDDISIEILPKYPFSIYSGSAITEIGKIPAGITGADSIIVKYKLKVDENAVEGDNELELQVKKETTVWTSYVDNEFLINIENAGKPELKVYLRDSDILKAGSKATITLEMANVDESDVKFLQFTLIPDKSYELLSSSNYVYIGDIDSDDTESEDFDIYVNSKAKEVIIPVKLEYEDVDEKEYSEIFNLSFNVYSSYELSKYGLKEKSSTGTIFVVIIIGIIAYFYWKKKKKKKEHA